MSKKESITQATVIKQGDNFLLVRKNGFEPITIDITLVTQMLFPFCFRKCSIRGTACPGVKLVNDDGVLINRIGQPVNVNCELVNKPFLIPSKNVTTVGVK